MQHEDKQGTQARRNRGSVTPKPVQGPPGKRVDPVDPVEEASHESFPASDPPSFSPTRAGPPRPSGENPDKDHKH